MLQSGINTIVFIIVCISFSILAKGQNQRIDSMENDLKHPKNDTFRITLLYNLAGEYDGYDTSKGIKYLEQGRALADKMHYQFNIATYYLEKSKMLNYHDKPGTVALLDTAIDLFKKNIALNISDEDVAQSNLSILTCYAEKANLLGKQGKYEEAISLYLNAVDGWKASDEIRRNEAIANLYANISTIYFDMKQPAKALEYDKEAINYRLSDHNDELLARQYLYVSDDYLLLSSFDSAYHYVKLAKPLVEKINKYDLNHYLYSRMAKLFWQKKNYGEAINYFKKALNESIKSGSSFATESDYRSVSECYFDFGMYDSARVNLLKGLSMAEQNSFIKEKLNDLKDLVKVEDKTNHPEKAYYYLKQADVIKDSLKVIEVQASVAEIENKYQSAEKEKEIIQLQKDKEIQTLSLRHKSTLNYILIGSLAGLFILSFLLYRNYQQKQELQKQKINELEKDKQLMAVDAMLKGQEEERSRLAKDLHDGLGGMLSGVKYSLNNMKDNLIVTPDNMAVFERSLDMIDTSIKELRRVAHNMMPEMLVKFGLDEALKEYCSTINSAKILKVTYQSFGMDTRLDNSVEIIIYRVVQELLNNILKHASASETLVQVIREGSRLNILVEDNGKGFDINLLEKNKGAGWSNIQSRVDYLKGHLDIHSEIDKGTSVSIEFNI